MAPEPAAPATTADLIIQGGPKPYTLLQRSEQFLAVYLWLGWIATYILFLFLLAFGSSTVRLAIVGAVTVAAFCPAGDSAKPVGPLMFAFGDWTMKRAAEYFNLSVQMTRSTYAALEKAAGTDPNPNPNPKPKPEPKPRPTPVLFGLEPHHVLPYSIFFASNFLEFVPSYMARGLMSSACFWLPMMKHVYTACSAAPVEKANLKRLLDEGISCAVVPGGVQEVAYLTKSAPKEIIIYLEKRKGFIKYALLHGAKICPVFAFGLEGSYNFWVPKDRLSLEIGRKMGLLPMLFFGAWGIPFGPPKRCELTVVVGEPLDVGPDPHFSEEDPAKLSAAVDATHRKFIDGIKSLFEDHKARLGYGDWTLKVV
eukprot:CAMPEP_0118865270 /NCGR_PEP_ID=MMETSP1163-20130328/9577_1 /TAXON_ID=124430 /ORGANISM="Phaeomonas parva, Strain CCMP2877" /LENGTH=366 /DNA_ID=CAMNT_0006799483 /DNA_START=161 /DNA_END=1261 /DNA_ORIENTATION=-